MSRAAPLLLLFLLLALSACGPKVVDVVDPQADLQPTGFKAKAHHWPDPDSEALRFLVIDDPWEGVNRNLYEVNATLDKYVMLPATNVYTTVLPQPVRKGISNVYGNLNEMPTALNSILQGRLEKAFISFSRFLINSSFGVLGLMDLASDNEKLPRQSEDVGQTLGYWGVEPGPYFVMPLLGPSNVRDTVGFGGDIVILYLEVEMIYQAVGMDDSRPLDLADLVLRGLNLRANNQFRYHSTGSPFEYEMVRFIYTKKRELDIER
ncbi:VacJ family lipoprotein [Pseudodesulfovibrio indicus]|uniref:ABC transporter n=1 Tax=Pseudodesulfovibrio indicus TaxID=1716143 RepID=A0A126QL96_9BACT|nr:VacJ family lipoprotein [Pseudodesulfovibrio indicus]AMK10597.1 ABC transporter [Pseudodesulfovibrio indicus]TDT82731.1 phospholipid-binding lipoprotein MlaA [Pseudodesulfovibrio indicus]